MRRTALALILSSAAICSCGACGTEPRERTAAAPAARERGAPSPTAPPPAPPPPAAVPAALFPLVAGARYHFKAVFDGRHLDYWTVVRRAQGAGQDLYYFIEEESEREGGQFIASDNIGGGLYTSREDGVYVAPLGFLDQLPRVRPDSIQRMLALPPKVNARARVEMDPLESWSAEFVVEAIETVTVPAGTFPGSVRITFTTTASDDSERARAWLAPGVGLVRWERVTGRIEELVAYEIPR